MAGQSLSAWLDQGTSQRLGTIAKLEARPTSQLVAAAVKFYARLPEEARAALRKIEALGSDAEQAHALRRVTRALLDAQWDIATRQAAEQAQTDVPLMENEPPSLAAVVRALRARRGELELLGVRHASVFGSVARGDARPDSDIDIVVDVDPVLVPGLFAQGGIQQALEGWLDHPVDLARRDRLRSGVEAAVAAEGVDAF